MSTQPTPSPLLPRWLPTVLLILAALGVPAAAVSFFTHLVTQYPLFATILGLVYEVIILLIGFTGKVWGTLEARWVTRAAEWLDLRALSVLSGYHRHYCQYIIDQHRDFDIKGLSLQGPYALELDQVFIELRLDATTLQDISANPIPKVLAQGSHTVWDFLTSPVLEKHPFVIVGPPGSGKTTLLKHISLLLLVHRRQHHRGTKLPHKLPILLFLRDHANAIHISSAKEQPDFTLATALTDHLRKWEQQEPPKDWIEHQLKRGRCLVMLDGLDEVADQEVRTEVVNWVQRQIAGYRKNRFLITSRPFGIRSNPLSGVTVMEVRPFTEPQVERFVHKWYLANEIMRKQKDDSGVRMRARAEAKNLLGQLYDTPDLLALTVNPLLLTMIAIVHRYGGGGQLPDKRVSLYEDICKVFLGGRQQAREQFLELKPEQTQLVLQSLAYHMMRQGTREITPVEATPFLLAVLQSVSSQMSIGTFFTYVENVSGLLLEREHGIYEFAHKTFQEYLTAVHIREHQQEQELITHVNDVWWQETIRLYCGLADATPIIRACLKDGLPSVSVLTLALDCQKEARSVKPEVKDEIEHLLEQGIEDTDPLLQHVVAEVLLARRLRQMVLLTENTFVDTSLITCGEYQFFLDEQRQRQHYYQPDHWEKYRFSPGQGGTPVLGIRSSDASAFCSWLTERETGAWLYRLPKPGEYKDRNKESLLKNFPIASGYWLSNQSLAWIEMARELLNNGEPAINLARALDLAHDLDLARNLARELDLARDLNRALDRDLARNLARNLDFDLDLARNLARELDRARDLDFARARDLDRARNLALELELELDRAHDRDLARNLARNLARASDLDRARASDLDLAHNLDRARELELALARASDLDRARDLARDLELELVRDLDLDRPLDLDRNLDLTRTLTRAFVLTFIIYQAYFTGREKRSSLIRIQHLLGLDKKRDQVQMVINKFQDIYHMLVTLELRVQGKALAYEGILIVKERSRLDSISTTAKGTISQ